MLLFLDFHILFFCYPEECRHEHFRMVFTMHTCKHCPQRQSLPVKLLVVDHASFHLCWILPVASQEGHPVCIPAGSVGADAAPSPCPSLAECFIIANPMSGAVAIPDSFDAHFCNYWRRLASLRTLAGPLCFPLCESPAHSLCTFSFSTPPLLSL